MSLLFSYSAIFSHYLNTQYPLLSNLPKDMSKLFNHASRYLARAFMLNVPYCGSGIESNEQGSIVERF